MNKLNDMISDIFSGMIPTETQHDGSGICNLKKAAVNFLVIHKKLTCGAQIHQLQQIDNQTDLELFIQQFNLSTEEILNIYRNSYGTI